MVITLNSSNTNEGTIDKSTLTFTTANWNIAQQVTVTGVDDAINDGDQNYSIILNSASSTDANYNGIIPGMSALLISTMTYLYLISPLVPK